MHKILLEERYSPCKNGCLFNYLITNVDDTYTLDHR